MAPPPLPAATAGMPSKYRKLPALGPVSTPRAPQHCARCGPTPTAAKNLPMETTTTTATTTAATTCTKNGSDSNQLLHRTPSWFYGSCVHTTQNSHGGCGRRNNLSLPGIDPRAVNNPLNQLTENVRLQKVQDWLRRSSMPGYGHKTLAQENLAAKELLTFADPPRERARKDITSTTKLAKNRYNGVVQRQRHTTVDPFLHPYVVPIKNKDLLPGSMVPLSMDSERFEPDPQSKWHGRQQAFTQSQAAQQPLRSDMGPIGRPHTPEIPLIQRQRHRFGTDLIYSHHSRDKRSSCEDYQVQRRRMDELHNRVKTLLTQ